MVSLNEEKGIGEVLEELNEILPPEWLHASYQTTEQTIREDFDRICTFLNVFPQLEIRDDVKNGWYDTEENKVVIGTRDITGDCRFCMRKKLAHEILHATGLRHNRTSRSFGLFSSMKRDTFSEKIVEWAFQ